METFGDFMKILQNVSANSSETSRHIDKTRSGLQGRVLRKRADPRFEPGCHNQKAGSQKVKKCTVCEEFPSVCMLCGVCQNGGFRRDTNVETSTGLLVGCPNGVLQRYELVYQLGSADSECSYFGSFGRLESSEFRLAGW